MNKLKRDFIDRYSHAGLSMGPFMRDLTNELSLQKGEVNSAIEYAIDKTEGHCFYCGADLKPSCNNNNNNNNNKLNTQAESKMLGVHMDHIYPSSKFGLFVKGNIALSCIGCNTRKVDMDPIEFYRTIETDESKQREFKLMLDDYTKPYLDNYYEYYQAYLDYEYMGVEIGTHINNLLIAPLNFEPSVLSVNEERMKDLLELKREKDLDIKIDTIIEIMGFPPNSYYKSYAALKRYCRANELEIVRYIKNDDEYVRIGKNIIKPTSRPVRKLSSNKKKKRLNRKPFNSETYISDNDEKLTSIRGLSKNLRPVYEATIFSELTERGQSILATIMYIVGDSTEIEEFSLRDLMKFSEIHSRSYLELEKYLIEIKEQLPNVFEVFEYYLDTKVLQVQYTDEFIEAGVIDIKDKDLYVINNADSIYTNLMYINTKKSISKGIQIISVEDFRLSMDIPLSYSMSKIDARVITPAVRDLASFGIIVSVDKIKAHKGNRIAAIKFTISG